MEFKEFCRQRGRMCVNTDCIDCGLSSGNNHTKEKCASFCLKYPEKAEMIIKKWISEHPEEKTEETEKTFVDAGSYKLGEVKGYEEGLQECWELVKKMIKLDRREQINCFGHPEYCSVANYFYSLTPKEALNKYQEWESREIHVSRGDIVVVYGEKVIIVNPATGDELYHGGLCVDDLTAVNVEKGAVSQNTGQNIGYILDSLIAAAAAEGK